MSDLRASPEIRSVGLAALFGLAPSLSTARGVPPLPNLLLTERSIGRAEGEAAAAHRLESEWQARETALLAEIEQARLLAVALQEALATTMARDFTQLLLAALDSVLAAAAGLKTETVESLVAEALSAAPAESASRLVVHPDMADAARPMLPHGWTLATDPELSPGAVRAECDGARFAASLARRASRLGPLLEGEI